MKKFLLAVTALLALTTASKADIVVSLGTNPNSSTGHFSDGNLSGAFKDDYTFTLSGSSSYITFASATNDFLTPADRISNFTGQLFQQVGAVGGGDDIPVSVAAPSTPCAFNPTGCQLLSGGAILTSGNYYLEIRGIGGGTSGYGGDLTTVGVGAVPEPSTWAMMILGFCGVVFMGARRRKSDSSFRFV